MFCTFIADNGEEDRRRKRRYLIRPFAYKSFSLSVHLRPFVFAIVCNF